MEAPRPTRRRYSVESGQGLHAHAHAHLSSVNLSIFPDLQLRDLRWATAEGLHLAVGARHDLDERQHLDAEALTELLVVVEHDLVELDLGPLIGDGVDLGRHGLARAAPAREELDHHDA